jgi:hypothetical protein
MVFWLPNLWESGRTKKTKQKDLESEPKGKEAAASGSQDAGVTVEAGSNDEDASSQPPIARAENKSPEDTRPDVIEVDS